MTRFLFNIVLAIIWCALNAKFTAWNFMAGMVVGALVVSIYGHAMGHEPYIRRGLRLLHFLGYFFKMLLVTNWQVAWEVLTPSMHQTPRIIRYNVENLTEAERATLASAITLTPGTLVVDISPCNKWIYIHAMYADSREKAVKDIDDLALHLKEMVFS